MPLRVDSGNSGVSMVVQYTGAGRLTRTTMMMVAAGAAVLAVSAWTMTLFGPFDGRFATGALATYAAVGSIVIARIGSYHPYPQFGAANAVTLSRLLISSLFAGLAVQTAYEGTEVAPATAWFFVGLALLALALDGVDGRLARKLRLASPFGARFDMETDALQIFLLSIIAFTLGKAGAWVLLSGLMRYLYVAAGRVWPVLAAPMPPSQFRKAVCVIQSAALTALLAPVVVPPQSTAIAGIALILLIVSFGRDVLWSLRSAAPRPSLG